MLVYSLGAILVHLNGTPEGNLAFCPEDWSYNDTECQWKPVPNNTTCSKPIYVDEVGGSCITRCPDYLLDDLASYVLQSQGSTEAALIISSHPEYFYNTIAEENQRLCRRCPPESVPAVDKVTCIELPALWVDSQNCTYYDFNLSCAICRESFFARWAGGCDESDFSAQNLTSKDVKNCKYYTATGCDYCDSKYLLIDEQCALAEDYKCLLTDGQNCIQCFRGYELSNSVCERCGISQYSDGIECRNCSTGCSCESSQILCEDCLDGYYNANHGSGTECQCSKCFAHCQHCNGSKRFECTVCETGYQLFEGQCLMNCKKNEFNCVMENGLQQVCTLCANHVSNCSLCHMEYPSMNKTVQSITEGLVFCDACEPDFFEQNGSCLPIPKLIIDASGDQNKVIVMNSQYFWVIVAFLCAFIAAVILFVTICAVCYARRKQQKRAELLNNSIVGRPSISLHGDDDENCKIRFGDSRDDDHMMSDSFAYDELSDDSTEGFGNVQLEKSFNSVGQ